MISLQDFDDVLVDLFLPPLVVLLYLPLLVTKIDFEFCRIYFFLFFFSKTKSAVQLPPKKRVATQGLSVSFHIGLNGEACVRTDGQSDRSD